MIDHRLAVNDERGARVSTVLPPARRLSVRHDDRCVDLAVPEGVDIQVVLDELGLDLGPGDELIDQYGHSIDTTAVPTWSMRDGEVLTLARRAAPAPAHPVVAEHPDRQPSPALWAIAATCVSAVLVGVILGVLGAGSLVSETTGVPPHGIGLRAGVGAALLAAAGIACAMPRRAPAASLPVSALLLAAAAAGLVPSDLPHILALRLLAAVGGALVAVAVRWLRLPSGAMLAGVRVLAWALVLGAAAIWAGVMLDWPPAISAAAVGGLCPLSLRLVPATSLTVPPGYLVDVDRFAQLRWTVRGSLPGEPGVVHPRAIELLVRCAEAQVRMGVIVVSLTAPACVPIVLAASSPGSWQWWLAIGFAGCLVLAFTLGPRSMHGAWARWATRAAATAVLVEAVLAVAGAGWNTWDLVLAVAAGLLAVALMWCALLVVRDVRLLGVSRLGDLAESLGIVLALPLGLVAAGIVDLIRTAVA